MSHSLNKLPVSEATNETTSTTDRNKVRSLFDQIESIKSTICMANGDRPELWIQRQNLQDLYQQIILSDVDFTIDKKLEQDLWNLVFKSQINYFQAQIKESRTNGSSNTSGVNVNPSGSKLSASSALSATPSQKRLEAQANLFFFLEAARGFYTKLLEDIVFIYDFNELVKSTTDNTKLTGSTFLLPFCQRFPSIFDKINSSNYSIFTEPSTDKNKMKSQGSKEIAKKESPETQITDSEIPNKSTSTTRLAKTKQILYICQHILTHLGDIARYANLFQQAKNYYLHAIKLVPYLGHPYNQLGILFETSRTNQLSTIFYYVRSVACRYNFPLASTNMENFFKKLVDIPLTRYNPSLNNPNSINNLLNNNEPHLNLVVKLSHKDLINLYLQINAIIYYMSKSINALPNSTGTNSQRISSYIELFKTSFKAFVSTPLQREKLDSTQLSQMITILIFLVTQTEVQSTDEKPQSNSENKLDLKAIAHSYSINLLVYLIETLVYLFNEADQDELVMPAIYISFNFIEHYQDSRLIIDNQLWSLDKKSNQSQIFRSTNATVKLLNRLSEQIGVTTKSLSKYCDYPLSDDRMLDSFLPFKEVHSELNFSKYMRNRTQPLDSLNEAILRKKRVVECVKRVLNCQKNEKKNCFIKLVEKSEGNSDSPARSVFELNLEACKMPRGEEPKEKTFEAPDNEPVEALATVKPQSAIEQSNLQADTDKQPKQPLQQRKRRQVVAIHSLEASKANNNLLSAIDSEKIKANTPNIPPMMLQQQQQMIAANKMSLLQQQGNMNASNMQSRGPIPPISSIFGAPMNPPLLNEPPMFQNKPNPIMFNNPNLMMNQPLIRNQFPQQQQQQQPSFFPSASQRQFQQPNEINRGNFNQLPGMNYPKPNNNYSNFMSQDMGSMMGSNIMCNVRPGLGPMPTNLNYNHQNVPINKMMGNNTNVNFNNQMNNQNMPVNYNFNNGDQMQQNNSSFFQQNQKAYLQNLQTKNNFNNQQMQHQEMIQSNQFNFNNFQQQRDNTRLATPQQFQTHEHAKMPGISYLDQQANKLPTEHPPGNMISMPYKNLTESPASGSKTDLIDRLASSKSFNNIWTLENDGKKNNSRSNSNSLPVENLMQNNPGNNSPLWSSLEKPQNSQSRQQKVGVSHQGFINTPDMNKLQITNMFNSGSTEPATANDGILTNILQQLNTNLFPNQSSGVTSSKPENSTNLVDLATIALPNTGSEDIEAKQNLGGQTTADGETDNAFLNQNLSQNSSIWSFLQQKNQEKK